jgi:bifunctional non-homologous end joining protein LigD
MAVSRPRRSAVSSGEARAILPLTSRTTLPLIHPILPALRPQAFNNPAWLFEPKYDGFRGILYLTRQSCALYSKRGNRFSRFEALLRRVCADLPRRELILDGEIIALDGDGRVSFWGLMRGDGRLAYAAFDLLWLNGRDLRQLPLGERKKRLQRLLPADTGALLRVPYFEEHGRELLIAACKLDLEGIVAKRKDHPYHPAPPWYKIKNPLYSQREGRQELFERRARA